MNGVHDVYLCAAKVLDSSKARPDHGGLGWVDRWSALALYVRLGRDAPGVQLRTSSRPCGKLTSAEGGRDRVAGPPTTPRCTGTHLVLIKPRRHPSPDSVRSCCLRTPVAQPIGVGDVQPDEARDSKGAGRQRSFHARVCPARRTCSRARSSAFPSHTDSRTTAPGPGLGPAVRATLRGADGCRVPRPLGLCGDRSRPVVRLSTPGRCPSSAPPAGVVRALLASKRRARGSRLDSSWYRPALRHAAASPGSARAADLV